ncbi:hypothetical protein B0I12_002230 [Microbacterium hydrothermale]|uniref:phage portal protein family protein n=1 Tax=Microbacterium hydrothermale TaxID=857427 RepID=UPI0022277833|nr:hypothetical protein [Microbacterium hydrothermale]MCW2165075.1 hypothetical protein [Microbacterium hydrothermale]
MADENEIGYQAGTLSQWASMLAEVNESNPDMMWPESNNVYDRMRSEDSQVGSVLRAVTQPILSTDWVINPNGAPDHVVRNIASDFGLPVKGEKPSPPLRTRDRFQWTEHCRLALTSLPFGHAYFEQVYRAENGLYHLRKLAWRPPRTIAEIKVARDGGLVGIRQHGVTELIPVDRLVAYVNEREGANWLGRSLLRTAYKNWLLKDRYLRVQVIAAERNGLGMPLFEGAALPSNVNMTLEEAKVWQASERKAGLDIAKKAKSGIESGVSIPNGAKFSFVGVTGTLPDMDKPIRYHDEQIARAVLAHFLNLGTETGSWALGSTFADFFTNSLNAVAQHIAAITQAHVIEDLVDANWGPSMPAPRIEPAKIGAKHPATAESIKALLESGAIEPDEALEADMRGLYNLPVKDASTKRELPKRTDTAPKEAA